MNLKEKISCSCVTYRLCPFHIFSLYGEARSHSYSLCWKFYSGHLKQKQGFVDETISLWTMLWRREISLSVSWIEYQASHHKIWDPFNPFAYKPWFLRVCSTSLLKTLRAKEKLLISSNFSYLPLCFLPVFRTFHHFHQIKNCRLQILSVWNG